uniref:Type 4a pilus biogenesis protein PilO n=1 Tax=candidate division WWE3 bacterium TaxID=2053526 RepID=A0A7C4Y290_UNCKA
MDTHKIKNTLTNFVVPLVALFVTLGLILLVILPQIKNWPKVQEEMNKVRSLEALLETKRSILDKIVDFQAVVDEDSKLFGQALSSEPMVPELLTQVDMIAKESGLEVTRLSYSVTDVGVGPEEEVASYKAVIINLGTLGNYDQINTFLANLEDSARLLEVLSFRFSGENLQDSSQYAGTFVLRSPYLKVESQAETDTPITLDISSPDFMNILSKVKSLKYYDIKVDTKFFDVTPSDEPIDDLEELGEFVDETTPEDIAQ